MLKNILFATLATTAMAIELTPENWDEQTAGKTAFIKFYAPWCGHCKALAPAWDKLTADHVDSTTTLIGEVDCAGTGKSICEKIGVKGFPTLKFGAPSNLEAYSGGRDIEALTTFALGLKPSCNVGTLENCDDDKKETIAILNDETVESLATKISTHEKSIASIEETFNTAVASLQGSYEGLATKKTADIAELVSENNIGLVKSVHAHKIKSKDEL